MARAKKLSVLSALGIDPRAAGADVIDPRGLDPLAVVRRNRSRRGPAIKRDFENAPRGAPDAQMYAPRQGVVDRAYEALDRLSPGLGGTVRTPVEGLFGLAEIENALRRGVSHAAGSDIYAANPDLQSEDALVLGITGVAPAAFKGLGIAGRNLAEAAPEVLRRPFQAAGNWARENAPVLSRGEHPLAVEPDYVEGSFSVRPPSTQPAPAAVTGPGRAAALPAPPKVLALPTPGPRPDPGYKPRGGQWWPEGKVGELDATKAGWSVRDRGEYVDPDMRYQPVSPYGEGWGPRDTQEEALRRAQQLHEGLLPDRSPETRAYREAVNSPMDPADAEWLRKALLKYIKNDFGTEGDPLAALAAHGRHYDPEMTRERWQEIANSYIMDDSIGDMVVPPHADYPDPGFDHTIAQQLGERAPWLAKQPVTDRLYGLSGFPDMEQFTEFFPDLLSPEVNGIPLDLAVRRDSLQRMSFPQAVEQVGRYNQWKAQEAERRALAAMNNPALSVHKDYGDGMRWVKIGMPEGVDAGPSPVKSELEWELDRAFGGGGDNRESALRDALQAEGDAMGHCVGGYCDDVMHRGTGIYSLRDAKGQPHVTIETSPADRWLSGGALNAWEPGAFDRYLGQRYADGGVEDMHAWAAANFPDRVAAQNIEQIKGKQNAKPVEQYLPYVQDFVKSHPWAAVQDLHNADLVKLPDSRYITTGQYDEGLTKAFGENAPELMRNKRLYGPDWFERNWAEAAPHFEGYKRGGLVVKKPCSCDTCSSSLKVNAWV